MKNFCTLLTLSTVLWSQTLAIAQEESAKPDPKLEMNIEITMTIMKKMFDKAELTDEQSSKVDEILEKHTRPSVVLSQKLQNFMSKKERDIYNKARKMAQKAKLTEKEMEDYALRKAGLSTEKQAEYVKLKKEIIALDGKRNEKLKVILSEEQIKKVPLFKSMFAKSNTKPKAANGSAKKDSAGADGN